MNHAFAYKVCSSLDDMVQCCQEIKSNEDCDSCPLSGMCIEKTTVTELADRVKLTSMAKFADLADEPKPKSMTQEEYDAEQGNLKRCDPDDM